MRLPSQSGLSVTEQTTLPVMITGVAMVDTGPMTSAETTPVPTIMAVIANVGDMGGGMIHLQVQMIMADITAGTLPMITRP